MRHRHFISLRSALERLEVDGLTQLAFQGYTFHANATKSRIADVLATRPHPDAFLDRTKVYIEVKTPGKLAEVLLPTDVVVCKAMRP